MRTRIRTLCGAAVVAAVLAYAAPASAVTITVNTASDDQTPNDGSVSLREAIKAIKAGNTLGDPNIASQSSGVYGTDDTIRFDIPGAGLHTIHVGSDSSASGIPLPSLSRSMLISGGPTSLDSPFKVAIDGTSAGTSDGFHAFARVVITGLGIENFGAAGIDLDSFF